MEELDWSQKKSYSKVYVTKWEIGNPSEFGNHHGYLTHHLSDHNPKKQQTILLHGGPKMIKPRCQSWDRELIHSIFNKVDAEAIIQLPVSIMGVKEKLVWMHTQHGKYTVKSAYSWLAQK